MIPTAFVPVIDRDHPAGMGGSQQVYRFENRYGASVVRFKYSYGGDVGLYELAVITWTGEDWEITYDTPLASDVVGRLTETEVAKYLANIAALPAYEGETSNVRPRPRT